MKLRLTFVIPELQRRAIACALKHKKLATRTEVVQFVSGTIGAELPALVERMLADGGVDDPAQLKLFNKPREAVSQA